MQKVICLWSFVSNDGVMRKAGDIVEFDFEYAGVLIGKGLVKRHLSQSENKAADTSAIETKPATKTPAKRATKKEPEQ